MEGYLTYWKKRYRASDKELTKLSVHSLSWLGLSLQRYKSLNTSENTWNTYKRTANPMYNLLVVLILKRNTLISQNQSGGWKWLKINKLNEQNYPSWKIYTPQHIQYQKCTVVNDNHTHVIFWLVCQRTIIDHNKCLIFGQLVDGCLSPN